MKDAALADALIEALALDWLHGHRTPITLRSFARVRKRPVTDVRRVVLQLQHAGTVTLHPVRAAPERPDVGIVLTRDGQCTWVEARAAQVLPDVHAQVPAARQLLRDRPGISEEVVAQELALDRQQAHQVVLMLRCLDGVHAALDVHGQFTALRLREA